MFGLTDGLVGWSIPNCQFLKSQHLCQLMILCLCLVSSVCSCCPSAFILCVFLESLQASPLDNVNSYLWHLLLYVVLSCSILRDWMSAGNPLLWVFLLWLSWWLFSLASSSSDKWSKVSSEGWRNGITLVREVGDWVINSVDRVLDQGVLLYLL